MPEILDLRQIYKSKFNSIYEHLTQDIFVIENDARQQSKYDSNQKKVLVDDLQLIEGAQKILSGDHVSIEDSYFIVDIGNFHIPGVIAEALIPNGIDSHICMPSGSTQYHGISYQFGSGENEELEQRMENVLRYFAEAIQTGKEKMEYRSLATLLDAHREYSILKNIFPSPKDLKKFGVKEVVYLKENFLGLIPAQSISQVLTEPKYPEEKHSPFYGKTKMQRLGRPTEDVVDYLINMGNNGFTIKLGGIDFRHNISDGMKLCYVIFKNKK